MRRLVAVLSAVCMLITFIVPASAVQNVETSQITATSISEEAREQIMNLPVFVTSTKESGELSETQKENIAGSIKQCYSETIARSDNAITQNVEVQTGEYSIHLLSEEEKQIILDSPAYILAFNRIQRLIDSGTTVNYVNIFASGDNLTTNSVTSTNLDPSDPAYWESYYDTLGTYNGYKFLFSDVAANVETGWVDPNNTNPYINWSEIKNKIIQFTVEQVVDNAVFSALLAGATSLSTIIVNPLAVSYSASSGYVKAKVSGDLYMRTVYISDNLNRVNGCAYYGWASTELFESVLKLDVKYPYETTSGGAYRYKYEMKVCNKSTCSTNGYYGNAAFYQSVISYYKSTLGYFTHDEYIDMTSAVAKYFR